MAATAKLALVRPSLSSARSIGRRTSDGNIHPTVAVAQRGAPLSERAISYSRSELAGRCLAVSGATVSANSPAGYQRLAVYAAKRVSTGRSLALSSSLEVIPGKEKEVAALCKKITALVEDKKKDLKNGILHFECTTDAYEENVIHFWERFDSFLSMNTLHASPEYSEFLSDVRPLLNAPVKLAAYEYKDGQIGCMLNPIGPKGEGGLDDATGQGGSGGGASYKQTSQSVQQGISDREGWGMERALEISGAQTAAKVAAEAIAKGLKSIFGQK